MVKFDHQTSKPEIFKDKELSILPITRKEYLISDFNSHHILESHSYKTYSYKFPNYIESIDKNNITSESIVLNIAYASNILNNFIDDDEMIPTVSGRQSSGEFDFNVVRKQGEILNINVSKSQMEIDGAFEGLNFLSLIEAKIDYPEDFLIRQLYYPFRAFDNIIKKPIKNIFLYYSNNQFSLYEYSFKNKEEYHSLKMEKQCNYLFSNDTILLEDIMDVYGSVNIIKEPKVPFPQANSFERVISLCEHLKTEKLNKQEISEKYSFDERQSDYYANAGIYLGLIEKKTNIFSLTKNGEKIFNLSYKEKQLKLVRCILQHEVFYNIFKEYTKSGEMPEKDIIVDNMIKSKPYNINENTIKRRASTVYAWMKWILQLENDSSILTL
jgi:hypothetical protein